jgi:putative protein kinase ArgK-like GTPase of G3E family
VATTGRGIDELVDAIWRFRAHSEPTRAARCRSRSEYRLRELVSRHFIDHLEHRLLAPGELDAMVDRIARRELDPYTAARDLVARALGDHKVSR